MPDDTAPDIQPVTTKPRFVDFIRMGQAHLKSLESDYPGRRVGCVIVGLGGRKVAASCNHRLKQLPPPCEDPRKIYKAGGDAARQLLAETLHAEEVLFDPQGPRWSDCKNGTAYVTLCPCAPCVRLMIAANIKRIVVYKPDFEDPKWGTDFKYAIGLMAMAGIELTYMPRPKILHQVLKKLRMAA